MSEKMGQPEFRIIDGSRQESREPINERELVAAAQQGNTVAFKELYEHYRERVYNLIHYSLKDQHLAEDALQTVFVKVFQALPFFRLESSFHTWLYRVALNECKNRKRRRKIFVPLTISNEWPETDPGRSPDKVHESRQTAQLVRDAVMSLKPKYRQVIVLKYLEELSYEEVASILSCSPGTVASRLYRALEILESRLRPHRSKKENAEET